MTTTWIGWNSILQGLGEHRGIEVGQQILLSFQKYAIALIIFSLPFC